MPRNPPYQDIINGTRTARGHGTCNEGRWQGLTRPGHKARRIWRVCCFVTNFTCLEARSLGGFSSILDFRKIYDARRGLGGLGGLGGLEGLVLADQLISLRDSRRGHSVHGTSEAILTIDLRSNFGRKGSAEREECNLKTLDCEFDAYTCGLGGAED